MIKLISEEILPIEDRDISMIRNKVYSSGLGLAMTYIDAYHNALAAAETQLKELDNQMRCELFQKDEIIRKMSDLSNLAESLREEESSRLSDRIEELESDNSSMVEQILDLEYQLKEKR